MANPRWHVYGYESSNQPQPDHVAKYDGGTEPPRAAIQHMYALMEPVPKTATDEGRPACVFVEIKDVDTTVPMKHTDGPEPLRFLTVRATEVRKDQR